MATVKIQQTNFQYATFHFTVSLDASSAEGSIKHYFRCEALSLLFDEHVFLFFFDNFFTRLVIEIAKIGKTLLYTKLFTTEKYLCL